MTMKTILTTVAFTAGFAALLASPASAQSGYMRFGPAGYGYYGYYGAPYAADDLRRSNLNPRDPAYAGGDTFGYGGRFGY